MLKKFISQVLLLIIMMSLFTIPCYANAGLTWSGDLTVEENSFDSQCLFDNILHLKLELNNGEDQSGVVLLKYKTPTDSSTDASDLATISVYQAFIDLNLSPDFLLRVGRQKISWGSGFSWNPTNYIGSGKNRTEFMIDNPGVDAIDTEYTWGDSSLVVALKTNNNWYQSGKAIKVGTQVSHCDLSISAFQQGSVMAIGADFATSLGDYTIYCETAWKAGEGDQRFYIDNNIKNDRPEEQYYLHGVLGFNRNFGDNLTIMLEYYYNQAGWNQKEAENFNNYLGSDKSSLITIKTSTLLADLRQNYLFLLLTKKSFLNDDLTVSASVLWNNDDQSYQLTPMLHYDIGQNAYFGLNANFNFGDQASEFRSLPMGTIINVKVVLSF